MGERDGRHGVESDAPLTDGEVEALCDAFVEANRAEFMDTDLDLPILNAIARLAHDRMRQAWHEGYGCGSADATDGWLRPGSPARRNPYARVIPPGVDQDG